MALQAVEGLIYSSGAKDNLLKVSNANGEVSSQIDLPSYAKSIDALGGKIIVGTKCGRMINI
jgi:hypothetical protein